MPSFIALLYLAAVLQLFPGYTHEAEFAGGLNTSAGQQREILDKHNALRRGVNPTARNMLRMEWNPKAVENAKRWANRCIFSHSPAAQRIVDGIQCGENLYMSSASTSWPAVIQKWYDEVKHFKYGVGPVPPNAVIGHYTQVVWYRSYQIGCYAASCPKATFKHYYVCQYCPAGNIQGKLKTPYKSGPPCGDCPSACDKGLCTNPCRYVDKYSNCGDLAKHPGCKDAMVTTNCLASCRCTTEIK